MLKDTGFLSFGHFLENLGINIVKSSWTLQHKQKQMLQKLLLKEQFKKTAEITGNLIGNKIADITSVGKTKQKK